MHAHGWRPNHHSGIHLTKSSLTSKSTSRVFLRPDDVFQIGDMILKIQRDAPHIPETSFGTAFRVNDNSQKRKRTDDQSQDDTGIKTREAVIRSCAGPQSTLLQQHNKVSSKMQVGEKTPPELLKASPGITPSIESTSLILREALAVTLSDPPATLPAPTPRKDGILTCISGTIIIGCWYESVCPPAKLLFFIGRKPHAQEGLDRHLN